MKIEAPSTGEAWHRVFLLLILSAALLFLFMAIFGAMVYVDSNRSVLGDLSASTGYLWKKESCRDLYRIAAGSKGPVPDTGAMDELCETARKNDLPPLSLRTIIEEQRASSGAGTGPVDPGRIETILEESKTRLTREIPALVAHFRPYQTRVAYMWLFIPGLIGGIGAYFYGRAFAPVLFAAVMKRFERMLFGKNRYGEMWETFVRQKKKP